MLMHANRLASFSMWGRTWAPVGELASAGFYAVTSFGQPDVVRCYHCGVLDGLWTAPFDPLARHMSLNPRCDLAVVLLNQRLQTNSDSANSGNTSLPGSRAT